LLGGRARPGGGANLEKYALGGSGILPPHPATSVHLLVYSLKAIQQFEGVIIDNLSAQICRWQ